MLPWSSLGRTPLYTLPGWLESDVADIFPFFSIAVLISLVLYLLETFLDLRQHDRLALNDFPTSLKIILGAMDEKAKSCENHKKSSDKSAAVTSNKKTELLLDATTTKFQSSRAYNRDKSSFHLYSSLFSQCSSLALMLCGYLPYVWHLSQQLLLRVLCTTTVTVTAAFGDDAQHTCVKPFGYTLIQTTSMANVDNNGDIILPNRSMLPQTLVFCLLTMLCDTLLSLPFDFYSTFSIEATHGFNTTTVSTFISDKVKGFCLSIVIGGPVVSLLMLTIDGGGEHFYLYTWAFMFTLSCVMTILVPVLIMPLFNTFTPLESGASLRVAIEALASQLHFPLTQLFVCDGSKRSSHSNAYFYGFLNSKRIVLYDTLLGQATEEEIVAILGHELGHWHLMHTYQMFVIQQLYIFFTFYAFGYCLNNTGLYAAFGFPASAQCPIIIGLVLFGKAITAPIDTIVQVGLTALIRRNEFQADAFAVSLGKGTALSTGLVKIGLENLSNLNPDPYYSAVHYSHPPLVERLAAIDALMKKTL